MKAGGGWYHRGKLYLIRLATARRKEPRPPSVSLLELVSQTYVSDDPPK